MESIALQEVAAPPAPGVNTRADADSQPESIIVPPKRRRAMSPEARAKISAGVKAALDKKKNAATAAVGGDQAETTSAIPATRSSLSESVENPKSAETLSPSPVTDGPAISNGSQALLVITRRSQTEPEQIAQIPSGACLLSSRSEAVEDMTDERLDKYIVGHFSALKKNIYAIAEGLTEKKNRLARIGCTGKWGAYVTYEVGMSVWSANRLVKNWNSYLQLGARIREAAEQAGVSFTKPAVKALLEAYNNELLMAGEPNQERFGTWVNQLGKAAKRQPNAKTHDDTAPGPDATDSATDDPGDPDPETGASHSNQDDPNDCEEQDAGICGEDENGICSGPRLKTVSLRFTPGQAKTFNGLIAKLKMRLQAEDRAELVIKALELALECKIDSPES